MASQSPENKASKSVQDDYILSRDFGANTRLNLQHYLWKDGVGYLLHPSIPTEKANLRVADIGSGTCIWLIELSRQLPPSARLDGFDVRHDQCPPTQYLPSNVSLRVYDFFTEPPEDLVGVYDVVHVQNFITIVKDHDPAPLIRNALTMLKPGGYLSWAEYDYQAWRTETLPTAKDYNDDLNKLFQYNATFGNTQKPNYQMNKWVARMPEIFPEYGLKNISVDRKPFDKSITAFLLDTFMVASHEISLNVLDPLGGGRGDIVRNFIAEIGRNRQNVGISLDRLFVVGQKPE